MKNPYLSIVIVGRNDNYGENFLLRINTFIRSLDYNLRNHVDKVELIITEWNPLSEVLPLQEVLSKPKNFSLRIITVPNNLHKLIGSESPVLEVYGKNVGIRRASGKFVLITNPDILFTQELIDAIVHNSLDKNTIYRTDRYDYLGAGIEYLPDGKLIEFAVRHTFCGHLVINGSTHMFSCIKTELKDFPKTNIIDNMLHTNACGDFILASKDTWISAKGMWESLRQRWHLDSISLYRLAGTGARQVIFTAPKCIFHMDHKRSPEDVPWDQHFADNLLIDPFHADSERQIYWGLKDFDLPEWNNKK
jgi:hypothetical protein